MDSPGSRSRESSLTPLHDSPTPCVGSDDGEEGDEPIKNTQTYGQDDLPPLALSSPTDSPAAYPADPSFLPHPAVLPVLSAIRHTTRTRKPKRIYDPSDPPPSYPSSVGAVKPSKRRQTKKASGDRGRVIGRGATRGSAENGLKAKVKGKCVLAQTSLEHAPSAADDAEGAGQAGQGRGGQGGRRRVKGAKAKGGKANHKKRPLQDTQARSSPVLGVEPACGLIRCQAVLATSCDTTSLKLKSLGPQERSLSPEKKRRKTQRGFGQDAQSATGWTLKPGYIRSSRFAKVLRLLIGPSSPPREVRHKVQGPIPRPPVWAEVSRPV
jgi:hypothetical protein